MIESIRNRFAELQVSQPVDDSMWDRLLEPMLSGVIYTVLGVVLFVFAFVIIVRVVPFSVRREIEEDQNIALGVILGSVILGISIIVAAAITG